MRAGACMITIFIAVLVAASTPRGAYALEELTDAEMDRVTAGSAAYVEDGVLRFDFTSSQKGGRQVDGSGTLTLGAERLAAITQSGSLSISDSAQQNLRALVNINAVNSPVQVLLNLNVNINSTVEKLRQINVTGALP